MDSNVPPLPPPPIPEPTSVAPVAAKPPTSGLAIASLALGLLPCGFTGVAGIICGVLAKSRIAKSAGRLGGDGLATAGIIVSAAFGVLAVPFVAILAGMTLPALAQAKAKAQRIQCVNNLKMIGLASRMYAIDSDGKSPTDFPAMASTIDALKILICPADAQHQVAVDWAHFTPANTSYVYFGKNLTNEDPAVILCYCTNHPGNAVNLLLADGSVQQLYARPGRSWAKMEGGQLRLKNP